MIVGGLLPEQRLVLRGTRSPGGSNFWLSPYPHVGDDLMAGQREVRGARVFSTNDTTASERVAGCTGRTPSPGGFLARALRGAVR